MIGYEKILREMTLEEKLSLLTGSESMKTCGIDRLGIPNKNMADGPHGVRLSREEDCVSFPNLCSVAATWDIELIEQLGEGIGRDCQAHEIDMLLGPGVNIKRHILCGRNFEYMSEDPVLAGEMGAAYIKGLQKMGVSASLKHYACNNQEADRTTINVDVDLRTLREIYLKAFEIAVKKSKPDSVMCAYDRVNSIWCSENRFLLKEVLKDEWDYEGFVVSDWGAVHDIGRAVRAGLDLEMPQNPNIVNELKEALDQGKVTQEEIDEAVRRVLSFVLKERKEKIPCTRSALHECAKKAAEAGIVLLKNENEVLPLNSSKYKKIGIVGEFAQSPNISGQGSAEVNVKLEYIDSPLEKLREILGPETEVCYYKGYSKSEYSSEMLWPTLSEFQDFMKECDVVVFFVGTMVSEDTEKHDRRSAYFNPNYEMFIDEARAAGKKSVVVMQTGGAMILGSWHKWVDGIVEMWLAGEAAGSAAADVLTGIANPSGKLPETFPNCMRADLEYPGDGNVVKYSEGFEVGYRYYDRHPKEVCYPFGHGLSYTNFAYTDMKTEICGDEIRVSLKVTNTGNCAGSETVQIYVGGFQNSVRRPQKELKAFRKVYLRAGESENIEVLLHTEDFAFYNVTLRDWITESGRYKIFAAASAQDIRCENEIYIEGNAPYTLYKSKTDRIG